MARYYKPFLLFLAVSTFPASRAQNCQAPPNVNEFVICTLKDMIAQRSRDLDTTKQTEAPSVATNSTTLADKSSAPDIAALSVNPSALSSKSRTPDTTDFSLTLSMYGVYSLWKETNPFDNSFYNSPEAFWWRRLSFSIAPSFPETTSSTVGQGSRSYGAKYLITKSRDPADPSNNPTFQALGNQVSTTPQDYAGDFLEIENYLVQRYQDSFYAEFGNKPEFTQIYSDANTR
jgi:hypothetical protein